MSKPRQELTRREAKLITRQRLMEAALGLLASEGHVRLSASQVAKEAGVAQPTFYVHFRDLNDLLATVGDVRMAELRQTFRRAYAKIDKPALLSPKPAEAVVAAFRTPLEEIRDNPDLFRVYVQERMRPETPLGGRCRLIADEIRADLIESLERMATYVGSTVEGSRLAMIADGLIGLIETLGLAVIDGRYDDEDEVIATLLSFARGVLSPAPSSS